MAIMFWMGEEKGGMGAGKAIPGVNWYLHFLRIFKEMNSPLWF